MKITPLRMLGLCLAGCVGAAVFAQSIPSDNPPPFDKLPPPTADDLAWEDLLTTKKSVEKNLGKLPDEANARKQAKADRAAKHATLADKAKAFYTTRPNYYWADEARRLEILSLIQTEEDGDDSVDKRLDKAVKDLRADTKVSVKIRAQGAAAYEFTRAVHRANSESARRNEIEKTARELIKEFPAEAPGYEALLALGKVGHGGPNKAAQIAKEIAGSQAPAEIRLSAQVLADRFALVGTPLASVLGSEGAGLREKLPTDQPVIVYSWATWGPGSIDLGRMIQARRFAAIGICLDDDVAAAQKMQHAANLGGTHVNDAKGRSGALASALKFTTAGQIYLVDAQGIIRDVLGGDDLEAKLANLGFKTPELVKP